MKIPPKRSKKIRSKLVILSGIKVGKPMQINVPPSSWRHSIMLHESENKTQFVIRDNQIWRVK